MRRVKKGDRYRHYILKTKLYTVVDVTTTHVIFTINGNTLQKAVRRDGFQRCVDAGSLRLIGG